MPETPIHEDTSTIFPQYQIRMPRQLRRIQPVTESPIPQPPAHNHLRLRILPSDRSHVLVPLFCREFIHSVLQSVHLLNNTPHRRVYTSTLAPVSQGYKPTPSSLAQRTILPPYAHSCHMVEQLRRYRKNS